MIALAASYGPGAANPAKALPAAPGAGASRWGRSASPATRRGRDYHNGLLKRARDFAAWLRGTGARVYAEVDAGAVAEKAWAMEAGLGWIGKNGLLIHEKFGSWLLLGALVTDLPLAPDAPSRDRCGECRACIPACPTDAIREGRLRRLPTAASPSTPSRAVLRSRPRSPARASGRVFGCDACQEACPWNRRAREATLVELRARPEQKALALDALLALTDEEARARFLGTPLMRAGRDGLVRAALAVCRKPLAGRARELAERLREDPYEAIRVEAARALG